MSNLYLFTGVYPYSQYTECFLEDEILYLSKTFEKVVIVPTRGDVTKREIPGNCISVKPIFPSKLLFLLKGMFNKRTFVTLTSEFFKHKVYASKDKLGVWIKGALVINNLLNSKQIKKIEHELNENDVCYYYWGKWSNLLTLFLHKKCHHVSRFHGAWDLWEEEYDDYAPLRKELSLKLDRAVFISRMGETYFKKRYPQTNTSFNPLGSSDYGVKPAKTDNIIRIASCSTVYPLKRVDLIFNSVSFFAENNPDIQIEWTHMGGGPNFDELQNFVAVHPVANLKANLMGNLDHSKVIDTFKSTCFDLFVNLSTNEGVPVSIMEAISFNVPVVATAVGGNSEIARADAGMLTSANPQPQEVAEKFSEILERANAPRKFWEENYNAEKNYTLFANLIKNLS